MRLLTYSNIEQTLRIFLAYLAVVSVHEVLEEDARAVPRVQGTGLG